MDKIYTYISLFSSAGVGCYGFKLNGFDCIATNELLKERLDIQRFNNKCKYGTGYVVGDITLDDTRSKIFREIDMWKEKEGIDNVDVVFATPPYQGMSIVNQKKKDKEERNSLIVQAVRMVEEIHPKIFIFENVKAFMNTICTDFDGTDKTISECIFKNLGNYNIFYKVINFKDYGVPSSRDRTIVIGTDKKYNYLSPLSIFPSRHKEITLRECIGDFQPLGYGERSTDDPLHFARIFPIEQLDWIKDLKEGHTAFENPIETFPYHIDKNGNKIFNKKTFMDKYRRLIWDKVCNCITTRSDILSSQNTIHPRDNRVLSIRELMKVMTLPDSFRWTEHDDELNVGNAFNYLKHNELKIRRCIGEAVPTQIIKSIAQKIKLSMEEKDDEQRLVFEKTKYLITNGKDIRIHAEDFAATYTFLPQMASRFSDKDSLTICCDNFTDREIDMLKLRCKQYDLSDFVNILPYIYTDPVKCNLLLKKEKSYRYESL